LLLLLLLLLYSLMFSLLKPIFSLPHEKGGKEGPLAAAAAQVKWNANGTWLLSGSRDQTVRVWDMRHTKKELNSWQGHPREVYCVAWHPVHLELTASGRQMNI
jgi:WD40 repeat protein